VVLREQAFLLAVIIDNSKQKKSMLLTASDNVLTILAELVTLGSNADPNEICFGLMLIIAVVCTFICLVFINHTQDVSFTTFYAVVTSPIKTRLKNVLLAELM
jgi:hypothetical protein